MVLSDRKDGNRLNDGFDPLFRRFFGQFDTGCSGCIAMIAWFAIALSCLTIFLESDTPQPRYTLNVVVLALAGISLYCRRLHRNGADVTMLVLAEMVAALAFIGSIVVLLWQGLGGIMSR